jgi:hypothetical protein
MWGKGNRNYVFLNNFRIAFVDVHLVEVIKFPMTPLNHRVKGNDLIYKLSIENETMIYATLREDD